MSKNLGRGLLESAENRRRRVAELLLTHHSHRQMAEILGVGRATIARDVARIRSEWREARFRNYDEVIAAELAKLDLAESAVLSGLVAGDSRQVVRLLAIMGRRAAMLGLDYADGLAERQVRFEEEKAELVVRAFLDTVSELGLSPSQSHQARNSSLGGYGRLRLRPRPILGLTRKSVTRNGEPEPTKDVHEAAGRALPKAKLVWAYDCSSGVRLPVKPEDASSNLPQQKPPNQWPFLHRNNRSKPGEGSRRNHISPPSLGSCAIVTLWFASLSLVRGLLNSWANRSEGGRIA